MTKEMDFLNHLVKDSDTITNIAQKYKQTADELMGSNDLDKMVIKENQNMMVPNMTKEGVKFTAYTTKPGDTIASIAEKYRISPYYILRYNSLYNLMLAPNQNINIYEVRNMPNICVVKESDTVESFLERCDIDAITLIKRNQKNWLKPGSFINI